MPNYYIGCIICGKPLRLGETHVGSDGLPVHEECYVLKVKLAQATTHETTPKRNSGSTSSNH
jgi:hypothetical protein